MKTLLWMIAGLVSTGVIVVLAMIFVPLQRTPPQATLPSDFSAPPGAGVYAMRLADCAGCHTAEGGEAFAGGRAIPSPFGVIYSSNITPDPEFGIGGWSLAQFRAALYDGIGGEGHNLYPAMPSANFRKMSEADIRALYGYFMDEVQPVAVAAPRTVLAFPFNQRWGIRAWKWLAFEAAGFVPRFDDPVLDRGAYLVEGPGHCGACHTPRDVLFIQTAYDSSSEDFLSGGEIDGWSVPGLRSGGSAPQVWSQENIVDYLRNGRNSRSAVVGEMHRVVAASLQYLNDDDLVAIATYLKHIGIAETPLRPVQPILDEDTVALLTSADPGMPLGARLYLDNCNACHFVDGLGADGVFPELDGSSLVNAPLSKGLIQVILNGAGLPSTAERPAPLRMPGFAERLSDEEVAELASFVRSAWSNDASAVSPAEVAANRPTTAATD